MCSGNTSVTKYRYLFDLFDNRDTISWYIMLTKMSMNDKIKNNLSNDNYTLKQGLSGVKQNLQ